MRLIMRMAVAAAVLPMLVFAGDSEAGAFTWAPASSATIKPGVQTFTQGAQCTANFVFADATDVYIGQAAHCQGTGAATDTDGCIAGTLPLGTQVEITGATRPGTIVYSSWIAMQQAGETDGNKCLYNDFALVRLDPADHARVNPSVPFFGGPVALGGATRAGSVVYSYGNSGLRLGLSPLSPKIGTSLGTAGNGYTHTVYTATPGIPGDSGSGFLDSSGRAIGVLSTLAALPLPLSNNVSDLGLALAYMNTHGGPAAQLVPGTEPFSGTGGSPLQLLP